MIQCQVPSLVHMVVVDSLQGVHLLLSPHVPHPIMLEPGILIQIHIRILGILDHHHELRGLQSAVCSAHRQISTALRLLLRRLQILLHELEFLFLSLGVPAQLFALILALTGPSLGLWSFELVRVALTRGCTY